MFLNVILVLMSLLSHKATKFPKSNPVFWVLFSHYLFTSRSATVVGMW